MLKVPAQDNLLCSKGGIELDLRLQCFGGSPSPPTYWSICGPTFRKPEFLLWLVSPNNLKIVTVNVPICNL